MDGVLTTGNCFVSVMDRTRQALPGAITTFGGPIAPQVEIADAQGQCRFLQLPPGTYSLECRLDGYSTVMFPSVPIAVGRNVSLEVTLDPAVIDVIR